MKKDMNELKKDFLEKRAILNHVKKTLKKEFIGIDDTIDQIVNSINSWYCFSHLQEKPAIVNLWGLTGVGKSSIVNRLSELLMFKNRHYKFDLGAKESHLSFDNSLKDLCELNDDYPIIITLDEFQHSRTVSGPFRDDILSDKNRMVWELIDSGKVSNINWTRGISDFENTIQKLEHLILAGLKIKNGIVITQKKLYINEIDPKIDEDEPIDFLQEDLIDEILSFAKGNFGLFLKQDVKNHVKNLKESEIIQFLYKILDFAKKPITRNFSNSLIFTIGNIDEAYTMSDNYSADISADEFAEMSRKITIPQMKEALKKRFRDEQIARLGNNHIIYPALDKKSYTKFIRIELQKIASKIYKETNFKLIFNPSVVETIYKEGVYPTQGVRPIFTTINQLIKNRLNMYITYLFDQNKEITSMHFSVKKDVLICKYKKDNKTLFQHSDKLQLTLEPLRKATKDDIQAITAVHESGHAVLSAVLLKTIPEVIYSVTSDSNSHGFVYSKSPFAYYKRKLIVPKIAVMLGGQVAESIIFGDENVTTGASSDIRMATQFIMQVLKIGGMGEYLLYYNDSSFNDNFSVHNCNSIEKQAKTLIEQATRLAKKTLLTEKKLLLKLSNFLSENRKMQKEEIEKMVNSFSSEPIEFITNPKNHFYRNHLKKMIESFEPSENIEFEHSFSLNNSSTKNDEKN